jgi:hypothetical protein
MKNVKLQNLEGMQDWLSVSDLSKLKRARKKLDVDEDSSLLRQDEMATGEQLRTNVWRSVLPPYSGSESTWRHIAVDRMFKKL